MQTAEITPRPVADNIVVLLAKRGGYTLFVTDFFTKNGKLRISYGNDASKARKFSKFGAQDLASKLMTPEWRNLQARVERVAADGTRTVNQ